MPWYAVNKKEVTYDVKRKETDYKGIKDGDIKAGTVHNYIDLSARGEADILFLIGKDNKDAADLYGLLYDIIETEYVSKYLDDIYWNQCDFVSAAKCVAFNVTDFLFLNNNKGYKVQCVFDDYHDNKTLRIIGDREYAIKRSIDVGKYEQSQGIVYICDVCRLREGDYGWMFRCKLKKECEYNGHDVCFRCVYDMIKKYNQLYGLLIELLHDDLPIDDCIHDIVAFIGGHVVKL